MNHIVILSTQYLGAASANGICAKNIVEVLKKHGHDVSIVCYENEDGTINLEKDIYTIKKINTQDSFLIKTIKFILKRIKFIFRIDSFAFDRRLVESYYETLFKIRKYRAIDIIIAMYFPFESVQALYLYKKIKPDTKAIIYELDSVGDGVAQSRFQKTYNKININWLSKIYCFMDKVFIMDSHKEYWKENFGLCFKHKMLLVDLPVLLDKSPTKHYDNPKPIIIYAGIIEKRYRSPSYLLSVLYELEKLIGFNFVFFSKGDSEDEIAEMTKKTHSIKQHGFLTQEVIEQKFLEADIFVSLGNSISRSVPSKIITYMSYGKPIIHFSSQKNDICNNYLNRYPLALIVDQSLDIEKNVKIIFNFINEVKSKSVNYEVVRELYYKNDPSYSVNLILKNIGH